jgi:hypothetical protein
MLQSDTGSPSPIEAALLVLSAGIAALGYGSALSSILRIKPNAGDHGILGLLSFGFIGCLFHFVTPLTAALQVAILGVGIGMAAAVAIRRNATGNSKALWIGSAAVCLCVLTFRQANLNNDAALYYLQTMRWIREQPVVTGLVNLHGRLAFNSMVFLIGGVADRSGIGWIANLLVILFVLVSLYIRLRSIAGSQRPARLAFWFAVLASLILLDSSWYGVLTADTFTAVLVIYWTCVALGLSASTSLPADIAMLVLTVTLAFVVKISSAPLIAPTVALVWIYRKQLPVSMLRVASTGALVVLVWMTRGFMLSGCAIYPVSQTCAFGLPWTASKSQLTAESLAIRSWARQPGQADFAKVLKDWAWLPHWFVGALHIRSIQILMAGVLLGLLALLVERRARRRPGPAVVLVATGLAACLVFWFIAAPDIRFGQGFLLSAGMLGASAILAACFGMPRFAAHVPALLVALMLLLGIRALKRERRDYIYSLSEPATYQVADANGHRIFVPKVADLCWNHELPCTPYLEPVNWIKVRWPANWPVPSPGVISQKADADSKEIDANVWRP